MGNTVIEKLHLNSLSRNPQQSIAFVLLVFFIVVTSWMTLKTGPVVMTRFNPDPVSFLSGGWRVIQGQVPHRDFHLIVGLLFYLLVALGMIISGFSVKAFTTINVILFILLTSWAWLIASRRMKPLPSLLASFVVGLIIAGTYHLGFSLTTVTYANLYNRYAYGMLFIILIEQLFIPENKQDIDDIAGGFSTGFLLFALFFLKLTYFCAGVLIILFRMLMIDFSRKWLFSVIIGALTITLPIFIYMKCDILPMFSDYRMISRVRGALLFSTDTIMSNIAPHWKAFLPLLVSWFLVPPFTVTNGRKTITKNTMSAALALLLLSAAFLNLTNCGPDDIPLLALISFIPLQFYKQSEKAGNGKTYWIQASHHRSVLPHKLELLCQEYRKYFLCLVLESQGCQQTPALQHSLAE